VEGFEREGALQKIEISSLKEVISDTVRKTQERWNQLMLKEATLMSEAT